MKLGKEFLKYNVAVALSGGKDSVALATLFLKEGVPIKAINVEHGIRGTESIRDSEFVEDFCEQNNIPLRSFKVDAISFSKENKLSLEESARILRYKCFETAVKEDFCEFVATAHHLSDSVETVLFNIFRGASIKGASGIAEKNGYIIRPLLNYTQEDIDNYVKENNLPYVTDSTNFNIDYTRNYIRKEILPKIKEIFPNVEKSIGRFSNACQKADEFIEKGAKKVYCYNGKESSFPCDIDRVLLEKCVIFALKDLGLTKDFESKHTELVLDLAKKQNGKTINLPNGILAVKDYDKITLFKKEDKILQENPFSIGETSVLGKKICVKDYGYPLKFDLDKLPKGCVFRGRKTGDEFTPFRGKKKSLKKYLIDKKIPERNRDGLVLVAKDSIVYVIVGVEISDQVKVDEKSTKIYTIGEKNV